MKTDQFLGYVRPDGAIGIRNHVAVMPSVSCANGVTGAIARAVPQAVPLYHGHGCGRAIEIPLHTRTLANLGRNPNVAAVLVVGLGCETIKAQALAGEIALSGKPVDYVNIQDVGGSRRAAAKGVEIVRQMQADANQIQRQPCPIDRIIVGLECGGSDAFSGITANPSVGLVSDWLVDQGGTVILTEATEMIGTGNILQRRACNLQVAGDMGAMIAAAEKQTRDILGPMASYVIAPGNMDGGMSSIREKSLGCIIKSGSRAITQVLEYGQTPTARGVVLMDGPGYDTESMTGLAAGGCQVIIFTTGRGNPIGYPIVPVIKVASTSKLYRHMEDDMDVDAGAVLDGTPLEGVAKMITALLWRNLQGEPTKAEANRQDGIVCLPVLNPAF